MSPPGWLRLLAAAIAGAALAPAPAAAAWAHGAHTPAGTNYRAEISSVSPPVAGLSVRTVEAGTALELTNHTGRTLRVLGYDGEPYLEVRPDGWYENTRSPATYLNDISGPAPVPASAGPRAEPQWRQVADEPVARWYDDRVRWAADEPPPEVAADPTVSQWVREWSVPVRDGDTEVAVSGTLDWVPPPPGWPWWVGAATATAAVTALGLAAWRRAPRVVLAALLGTGGVTALVYAVTREIDAGADSVGQVLTWLITGALWPALAALGALAAGTYLLVATVRSPEPKESALMAVVVAGACLAIFAGVADTPVFGRSVPPATLSPPLARAVVLTTLAAGAGAAAAGALAMRRLRLSLAG